MKKAIKEGLLKVSDEIYRAKNRRKARILVYSDSRGLDLGSRLGKTGYGTYVWQLRRNYHVTYALCPEKYTTLLDFVGFMEQHDASSYDAVVCHCGIVDFSPRPLSSLADLRSTKSTSQNFDELFRACEGYYRRPFAQTYYGERTTNLYSEEFLAGHIVPRLLEIPGLIWLNSNRVLPDWDGNYHRGRPSNLDEVVTRFDAVLMAALPVYVDLRDWSADDIMNYTIDNIHFTRPGFSCVARRIEAALAQLR